ncbi:MAG: branched-chain-amino-acid transaminase [Candidatus Hydrogenedentota bacterium]|jgi:branched-chain amino acid aminotransferase|nr:MAG: branched-chain-amino-acid transaminase [Candidatus Hydrogenedentota bacterium]GIX45589.1 MAG: branched chain amino acid aminotransferase [Candidatus Sumerlaea sp.]
MKIWIDGQLYDKHEAKISVFDHCLLYGDGVFEGIRIYNGCIYRLEQHLDRLWSSAKYIKLAIPLSREEMVAAIAETVRANGLRDGYIRLVVTRGVGDLGLNPNLCPRPTVFIIADQIRLFPQELYEKGIHVISAAVQRQPVSALNPRVKSCNYLNSILARIEANNAGAHEALILDLRGFVVEGTADNVFVVRNGVITTPPVYLGALRGITRDAVIEIAQEKGLPVREEPFTLYEVYDADELFLTGTAAEVVPVVQVDGRTIGTGRPGPIYACLLEEFRKRAPRDGYQVYE